MGVEIADLAEEVENQAKDVEIFGEGSFERGGGGGTVNPVRHPYAGQDPVMRAVFEDVEDWHCGEGEAMDE